MSGRVNILIVEDNDKNRKLFRLLVEGMGYESLVASARERNFDIRRWPMSSAATAQAE